MAGQLPGVEVARRRRVHQSGLDFSSSSASGHGSSRRSSFCLYPSSNESHLSSISTTAQRSPVCQSYYDQKLGDAAREAKKRLDERLRAPWKSETKRDLATLHRPSQAETARPREREQQREIQTEIPELKKSRSKRFSWPKFGWKSSEQDECAVCLEQFKAGENLMHLPCAHKFHSRCLVPWLENNAHCPCCRLELV